MILHPLQDVLRPGQRVLEIGCGFGQLTPDLASLFNEVVALDIDGECAAFTRHRVRERSNVKVLHQDVLDYPLGDDAWDAIVLRQTLHFISDVPKLFILLRAALRPGGCVYVINIPFFDVAFSPPCTRSSELAELFKEFVFSTLEATLATYWTKLTRTNFLRFCDPERVPSDEKDTLFGERNRCVRTVETNQVVALLDMDNVLKELHLVREFLQSPGSPQTFSQKILQFQHDVMRLLSLEPSDLYFEPVLLKQKKTIHVEINTKPES